MSLSQYGLRAIRPLLASARRLSVFIFHRVLDAPDPLRPGEPTLAEFEERLSWIATAFRVVSLDDAVAGLNDGTLPARTAVITFDDGYADNYSLAMPALRRAGMPATFFIATGFLDGGIMFNDAVIECVRQANGDQIDLSAFGLTEMALPLVSERGPIVHALLERIKYAPLQERIALVSQLTQRTGAQLPTDLMMTSAQVADMDKAGMGIGAHTVSHPILARTDLAIAREEIAHGRDKLAQIIGKPVAFFAYPNGRPTQDYRSEHVDLVKRLGFKAAVSTAWGATAIGEDTFQIRRFTPWDTNPLRFGARMIKNLHGQRLALA